MKNGELLKIGDLKVHHYYKFEGAKVEYERWIGTGLSIGKVYYVVGFSPSKHRIFLADKDSIPHVFDANYDTADKKFTKAETF